MKKVAKSKGHICFFDGAEWYERNGELYRVNAAEQAAVMTDGYRFGRWECSIEHAKRYPTIFPFKWAV